MGQVQRRKRKNKTQLFHTPIENPKMSVQIHYFRFWWSEETTKHKTYMERYRFTVHRIFVIANRYHETINLWKRVIFRSLRILWNRNKTKQQINSVYSNWIWRCDFNFIVSINCPLSESQLEMENHRKRFKAIIAKMTTIRTMHAVHCTSMMNAWRWKWNFVLSKLLTFQALYKRLIRRKNVSLSSAIFDIVAICRFQLNPQ